MNYFTHPSYFRSNLLVKVGWSCPTFCILHSYEINRVVFLEQCYREVQQGMYGDLGKPMEGCNQWYNKIYNFLLFPNHVNSLPFASAKFALLGFFMRSISDIMDLFCLWHTPATFPNGITSSFKTWFWKWSYSYFHFTFFQNIIYQEWALTIGHAAGF